VTQGTNVSGPANGVGPTLAFLAPPATVTITLGQSILVTSQRALGTNGTSGANSLSLWICYRNGTGPLFQSGFGANGLSVPANTRVNFPMTATLTGLAAGTYTVGLCGSTPASTWNSNDPNGSTTAVVF
jgi:hypothetical protein